MDIAIIGFGAMGKRIKALAEERSHNIVAIIDPGAPEATDGTISVESLKGADVAIEFTNPEAAPENIDAILKAGASAVIGTTGWYDRLEDVRQRVEKAGTGLIYSSNFSIGVNIYFKIVEAAARQMNRFDEYDVWGHEIHHRNKADSPSGTAKTIEKIILDNIERKTGVVEDKLDRKIKENEFHFSSTRGGPVNFSHTVGFDSVADTITLTHTARNRDGYALGAVKAAEWLMGKKGFYGMNDFLNLK